MNKQNIITRYIIFILLLFISSINFNVFIKPSKIVSGGMNGLALLVKDFFNIQPDIFIFCFSVIILLTSLLTLGIIKSSSIIGFTFIYPVFINTTEHLDKLISINNNYLIIYAIIIGSISGIVNGTCFRMDLASGPIPLLSEIINKYTRISLGKITLYLNSAIILIGGYKYGLIQIAYAIISIYINSVIVDKITIAKINKK